MKTRISVGEETYHIKRLTPINVEEVQKVCDLSNDYFLLSDGSNTTGSEGLNIVTSLPPHMNIEDKFVIGVYNPGQEIVGVIDLLRNYPNDATWFIGLMLIAPLERGKGLGQALNGMLKEYIASQGGKNIQLGVLKDNRRASDFWNKLDYIKTSEALSDIKGVQKEINLLTCSV